MISALDCGSGEVKDKPTLSPATDDKPTLSPATDDKPTLSPATDDKPTLSPATDDKSNTNSEIDYNPLLSSNIMEDITPEENQEDNIGYDFLGSITN
jgi:hypothetical protein